MCPGQTLGICGQVRLFRTIKKDRPVLYSDRNLVEVKITAENGITFKEYRFTASRTGDSTVKVYCLTLNGKPAADFNADRLTYDFQLEVGQNTL